MKTARSVRMSQIGIPAAVVAVVVLMVVPVPSMVLDLLLALNLTLAVLVLLVALRVTRPLDFAVFPSLLLVATLFRLALNVSATRLVLVDGFAGKVIEAFGHVVVGSSIVVGLVIFLILVVIQFVVITNGAGRVAEVAARFTLDAMPGKQMAIDADLNSGLIDEAQARQRRADVAAEADFYGAMDGASKFVKGDAIAAIVITLVNLIGGLVIGVVQNGQAVGDAVATYSLLSVGDGLVSQIPALLLSMSTGIIVTRAATDRDMGGDILHQFGAQRGAIQLAGVVIMGLALVPSLPKLPFLLVGGGALVLARSMPKLEEREAARKAQEAAEARRDEPSPDSPEVLAQDIRVEPLELELAFDLIGLVDADNGGDLLGRVKALRRKLAMELGIVIPLVRTRDNLDLPSHTYAIRVHGVEVARGEAPAGHVLVIGDAVHHLDGTPTREPVFGLEAKWVAAHLRGRAEALDGTVVDRSSVITTHLAETVRRHAADLLGREDVKLLVDAVRATHPQVVDELTPSPLSLGEVQRCLKGLLAEGVAIRDLVRIFEAISLRARVSTDADGLVEAARLALGPAIAASHAAGGDLHVLTFEPRLEQRLLEALRPSESGVQLALDPFLVERVVTEAARVSRSVEETGVQPVLVCAQPLRRPVRRLVESTAPQLAVLAYQELGGHLRLTTAGVVDVEPAGASPVQAVG
ncbi:flagellar biosynthesis protein FlhA [Phycicoccus sonneratiae]|uniref:Flagellar biosynthesis protein FlhA n=1 Tax=Phycicoccus sonneratiae TaxID=2807628 RepID=A0ABS2CNP1_9MICO|nr:flagellar biosynthesis protein FlhA [Phycicoccus sonneraticus]MBM6401445.1 flagellar biosynthesis protein FlhA [Phycicoccus sonneraticus]